MRILVATDAWKPQVNGVVRSLESVARALREFGAEIEFLTPQGFATVPLADLCAKSGSRWRAAGRYRNGWRDPRIDHIHIATEGPVGFAVRRYCLRAERAFSPRAITQGFRNISLTRTRIPEAITYALLRRFHNAGSGVMVSTASIAGRSQQAWISTFDALVARRRPRPIHAPPRRRPSICRGRFFFMPGVSRRKRMSRPFWSWTCRARKSSSAMARRAGPCRRAIRRRISSARREAMRLPFIMPRRMSACFRAGPIRSAWSCIEALACGLPVAALPVPGPLDVIGTSGAGVLDLDLRAACLAALDIPREQARAHALNFTWAKSARQFLDNILLAKSSAPHQLAARPGLFG